MAQLSAVSLQVVLNQYVAVTCYIRGGETEALCVSHFHQDHMEVAGPHGPRLVLVGGSGDKVP